MLSMACVSLNLFTYHTQIYTHNNKMHYIQGPMMWFSVTKPKNPN